MSICKVEKIEVLRGYRYMITTQDGAIMTTPPSTSINRGSMPAAGIKGAIAAMTGPFWASIELDPEGYIATLEGVEF